MSFLSNLSVAFGLPVGLWRNLVLFGLAAFFINIGINHFVNPDFYLSIMPPAFPMHAEAVYVSGFFEVLLGVLLMIPRFQSIAAKGLMLSLIHI